MPRGRPRSFDEERALEAALQVFWDRGYRTAGLDEISERTGVGKQSLYNTFGDKRALFGRALERYARDSERDWAATLEGPASPLAGLRAFLGRWLRCPEELRGRGCLMVRSINGPAPEEPELAASVAAHVGRQRSRLVQAFERARDTGELPHDLDCEAAGTRLLAHVLGLASLARLPGGDALVERSARGELDWLDRLAGADGEVGEESRGRRG